MNSHMIVYMDSSALRERAAAGPDSELFDDLWRSAGRLVTSELARSEASAAFEASHEILDDLEIVSTDRAVADAAAELAERHGLDAGESVHLAAALSIQAPRVVVATRNPALAIAAAESGMAVAPRAPARAAS